MSFLLEELPYQKKAIDAVVGVFDGQQRNFFHNPFHGDVQPNILTLSTQDLTANKRAIIAANGLTEGEAHLSLVPDYCIEMETGTGKTLVYLRTIYELCEAYGFTKFIIIVPSVPIREGVLDTIASFGPQLHRVYGPRLHAFEYDSKKLTEVKRFISGTDLQVMVMTTQSFNSDDNIINQSGRDDSPDGLSYWQALSQVRPILIMDEPQEGMDTANITPRIEALNQTYSDIKKRQEIGRGLRICRNQDGQRVYDREDVTEGEEINQLTVIPNETYETFVTQYQSEIGASIKPRHTHKGKRQGEHLVRLCEAQFRSERFRRFWQRLGQRTDYTVHFDEEDLVAACVTALNAIEVPRYEAEIVAMRIDEFTATGERAVLLGTDTQKLEACFTPMDLIEELSENTQLAYPTLIRILSAVTNGDQLVRNPPRYLHEAGRRITRIKLDEMVRTIDYRPTGEMFGFDLFKDVIPTYRQIVPTPNSGVYDHAIIDSNSSPERHFAMQADGDPRVVCVLKLPDWYKIPTPNGNYSPDFGLVVTHKNLRDGAELEVYLVVETKSYSSIEELDPDEQLKIRCAVRHFEALGVTTNQPLLFHAPVDRLSSVVSEEPAPAKPAPEPMGFYAPKTTLAETLTQALAYE
ncbi:MAG: DEAD/DEAH box helicase family protein [Verrucomicrobia bacterium]|nr:DEAD/DEAH box helicase family protein [Verrucomicrobiota bacterium]